MSLYVCCRCRRDVPENVPCPCEGDRPQNLAPGDIVDPPKEPPRTITFRVPARLSLSERQAVACGDAVNLRLFGDKAVNEEGPDGRLVGKPMPPELEKRLGDLHHDLRRSKEIVVEVTLDIDTGKWSYALPKP